MKGSLRERKSPSVEPSCPEGDHCYQRPGPLPETCGLECAWSVEFLKIMNNLKQFKKQYLSILFWVQGASGGHHSLPFWCHQEADLDGLHGALPHPAFGWAWSTTGTQLEMVRWEGGEIGVFRFLSPALLDRLSKDPDGWTSPAATPFGSGNHLLLFLLQGSAANSSPLLLIPGDCIVTFDFP